ncbi:transglutaminase domain-containing protein [Polaribacter sp. SA4-12]|uniref:transglutaminase domain-containing protein n=1 Tax=Polaribacter sp. SA4-12 TaxID=1312072 RepID=UPI000B3CF900|nr:transglutaminase domain-containing protein [Polaribacter sp. SA4-12]ARV13730.1 hypothetical protein BTO07_00610 [Polaribacter sp. SA4-12]
MKYFLCFLFIVFSLQITAQKSDFKNLNFEKSDNTAKLLKGENLYNLPLLTYNLTSKLDTDVEKFRAIYTWICQNIKGDYYMHRKVSKNRDKFKNDSISFLDWNKEYSKKVFKKLLKNKKTMCTGYAYLLKTMSEIANIECRIIDGYHRNTFANIAELSLPNHSWNAVKLNNKWYLADATLSSGYTDLSLDTFIFDYNDGYFLTDPKIFIQHNYPLEKKWTLLNPELSKVTRFLNTPLMYGAAIKQKIYHDSSSKMNTEISKNETVNFHYNFLEPLALDKIELRVDEQSSAIKTRVTQISKERNTFNISCNFNRKGLYDIHLYYKNEIISSQSIEVKNKI